MKSFVQIIRQIPAVTEYGRLPGIYEQWLADFLRMAFIH